MTTALRIALPQFWALPYDFAGGRGMIFVSQRWATDHMFYAHSDATMSYLAAHDNGYGDDHGDISIILRSRTINLAPFAAALEEAELGDGTLAGRVPAERVDDMFWPLPRAWNAYTHMR